ncbi:MAG: hypothetical protein WCJ30_17860 [Deltaproteobacteria bacterium]
MRRVAPWSLVALLLLAVASGRVLIDGSSELRAGDAAQSRGDLGDAIRRWRRAAHWYLPGSPFCARAYDRLEAAALAAEAQGRGDQAFSAWRAVRASALSTRWLVIPQRDRLERANRHIAALLAEMPQPPEDRERERARVREDHLSRLNEDHAPEPAWVVMLAAGFAAWFGAAVWAARRGWNAKDEAQTRTLVLAGAMLVVGMALFLLGVARA